MAPSLHEKSFTYWCIDLFMCRCLLFINLMKRNELSSYVELLDSLFDFNYDMKKEDADWHPLFII